MNDDAGETALNMSSCVVIFPRALNGTSTRNSATPQLKGNISAKTSTSVPNRSHLQGTALVSLLLGHYGCSLGLMGNSAERGESTVQPSSYHDKE